jgi:hypothetical protein
VPSPKFEVIEESSEAQSAPHLDLDTVLEGLKALPRKIAHSVASCFALVTVATVFWLALAIIGNPNPLQLTGLAGYCLFILTINWIVRRR